MLAVLGAASLHLDVTVMKQTQCCRLSHLFHVSCNTKCSLKLQYRISSQEKSSLSLILLHITV